MKTRPASALPTPTDHFTNFTEISYEKRATATTSLKYRAQPTSPSARQSGSPRTGGNGPK